MSKVKDIIKRAYSENRMLLMEHESKDIIKQYDIPVGNYKLVVSIEEALDFANKIGYPIVAKVMSPDIIHKTEAGIIKLNIQSPDELKSAYPEIIENAKKHNPTGKIIGVNIQEMAKDEIVEVIVGGMRDINFGSILMFGLGGIFVEIFKDVVYRVCPIDVEETQRMIQSIKAYPLLNGYRGREKADMQKLKDCLLNCCKLLNENPEIKELDLNPIIVFKQGNGLMVVDARIILEEDRENE